MRITFDDFGACTLVDKDMERTLCPEELDHMLCAAEVCHEVTERQEANACRCLPCSIARALRKWERGDGRKFILRHPSSGPLRESDDGYIVEDGVMGCLDSTNVYLTTYAEWPDRRRPKDIGVGERIRGVKFRLSGECGVYDVYRVK